jgi:hypothetical protein
MNDETDHPALSSFIDFQRFVENMKEDNAIVHIKAEIAKHYHGDTRGHERDEQKVLSGEQSIE